MTAIAAYAVIGIVPYAAVVAVRCGFIVLMTVKTGKNGIVA
jgi:hypothetical protein